MAITVQSIVPINNIQPRMLPCFSSVVFMGDISSVPITIRKPFQKAILIFIQTRDYVLGISNSKADLGGCKMTGVKKNQREKIVPFWFEKLSSDGFKVVVNKRGFPSLTMPMKHWLLLAQAIKSRKRNLHV